MKPWRDMDDAEKGALLLDAHRGESIQIKRIGHDWSDCERDCLWMGMAAYRVKPKARNLTHDIHVYRQPDGGVVIEDGHWGNPNCFGNITHTYTITDGRVTACDTIIHDGDKP